MATLVTFDVDGTLIHSIGQNSNALHKAAFASAFKQVFGIDTDIDIVKHHGSTDPNVLLKVLVEGHGVAKEEVMPKLEDLKSEMLRFFDANVDRAAEGLGLLPGVTLLLQALAARPNTYVGLVTGNLEPIGWGKMEALGVKHLFTQPVFGGFGSDFCSGNFTEAWRDRAEMIRIARGKCPEPVERVLHVGDTPYDMLAAVHSGATPLGVTTGIFPREELHEVAPDATILASLEDTAAVLTLLQ